MRTSKVSAQRVSDKHVSLEVSQLDAQVVAGAAAQIKRALDIGTFARGAASCVASYHCACAGADGVVVPNVETAEQLRTLTRQHRRL